MVGIIILDEDVDGAHVVTNDGVDCDPTNWGGVSISINLVSSDDNEVDNIDDNDDEASRWGAGNPVGCVRALAGGNKDIDDGNDAVLAVVVV